MGNFLETGVPSELQFFCSRCGDVQVITVKDADHFKTVLDKAVAKKLYCPECQAELLEKGGGDGLS